MKQIDYLRAKLDAVIPPQDLFAAIKANAEKFVIIDVRNAPAELKKVKIPNAIEIPEKEIASRLPEIPRDREIIVYDWDYWSTLSTKAAIVLLEKGYRVRELYGGMYAWETLHKLPVTELEQVKRARAL